MRVAVAVIVLTGCYTRRAAAPDINAAWRGRARVELEARIGMPTEQGQNPDGTTGLRWIGHGVNVKELPGGHLDVNITPTSFSVDAEAHPGVVEKYNYTRALAVIAPDGVILSFDGAFAAGFPSGVNARTGLVMGLAGAMGASSDATTPIPSAGLYIGGMIGPRLALIGSYSFINAKDDAGFAMAHAWGFGVQYWPAARLAVRAAPAAVLDLDPGLADPTFALGGTAGVGYALVRAGSFVLDLRFDAVISTSATFGMAGIGVNVN